MSHRNRQHPANFEESLKINVEPIEQGDECGYLVYAAGHGGIQKQFAADKDAALVCIAEALEDWKAHCKETRETGPLEKTVIDGPIDLPAE